jgi:hypothetical protein
MTKSRHTVPTRVATTGHGHQVAVSQSSGSAKKNTCPITKRASKHGPLSPEAIAQLYQRAG